MNSKDERGKVVEVLRGHTTAETSVSVDDYPYASTWTTRRYWVETAEKGAKKGQQRRVAQTLNPKTGRWNKPRLSGYVHGMHLVRYENGQIDAITEPHWDYIEWVRFWLTGIWDHLNESERKVNGILQDLLPRRDPKGWQNWFTLADRMTARDLPPYDQFDRGDLTVYLDESRYTDLRQYLELGGPDLRVEGWFKPSKTAIA
ncbi:hypothetical protein [Nocardia sp. NPDC003963]